MRFVLVMALLCAPASFAGTYSPVPYRDIPDPADGALRVITVKSEDRGPVHLLTGFLSNWHPNMSFDMIATLKPSCWRTSWPFWYPPAVYGYAERKYKDWAGWSDSAEMCGKALDTFRRLREQGMVLQVQMYNTGSFVNRHRITAKELPEFYDLIHTLVRYSKIMGVPIDYWDLWGEPRVGPYEGLASGSWLGTWDEFLAVWDTACDALREADPNARIAGPGYAICDANTIEPFLEHCKAKKQRLDAVAWNEIVQKTGPGYWIEPDKSHKNINEIRNLIDTKYPMLGVESVLLQEWGGPIDYTGPGTQMAFFYYFDLAGVDRAARAYWTYDDLDGVLVDPKTPRSTYWAWKAYADGVGVRLATQTNDRCLVCLASRDDAAKTVRAVVARSKRDTGPDFAKTRPPVQARIGFEGLPVGRNARVTVLRLGPSYGALREDELPALTTTTDMTVSSGRLSLTLDKVAENEVYSITITPRRSGSGE